MKKRKRLPRLLHGAFCLGAVLLALVFVRFTCGPTQLLTENPARLLGLDRQGSLCPGAYADITAVSGEGDILAVFVRGECVYERGV